VPAIQVYPAAEGVNAGNMLRYAVVVSIGAGWHVNANKPLDKYLIPTSLTLTPPPGITVKNIVYPAPAMVTLQETVEKLAVYTETFKIGVVLDTANDLAPGKYTVPGTLQYQACDDKRCLPPDSAELAITVNVVPAGIPAAPINSDWLEGIDFGTAGTPLQPEKPQAAAAPSVGQDWEAEAQHFSVAASAGGYMGTKEFLRFLDAAESGHARGAGSLFAGKAAWLIVVTVLIGGLLLNLTPCVLPLIPVNLAIIGAGVRAGSRGRGFMLGATYGAGMAFSYGMLGLGVVMGFAETFGAINATPWFNALIGILFFILGLAMFDLILIDFSRFQSRLGFILGKSGGYMVAFAMGIVAALLAGACVAPVIISTLIYAETLYARGVAIALVLPFLLGIGMALPWPFAGAGLAILPKPGKWMERIKYLFGLAILILAGYYAYLAYDLFEQRYLTDREAVQQSAQQLDEFGWQHDLAAAMAVARNENKPILIDFWATWCKNCLVMNKTTLREPEVLRRLDSYVKVKFQAENLADPATASVLRRYNVVGLPAYVVLTPNGD
jgi:thiol:disulfide interchange protein